MRRQVMLMALAGAIVLQLGVLVTQYVMAVYPLYRGTEIRLRTTPVDPRSMFRGNYAQLRYEISSIAGDELAEVKIRSGEVVYVRLKPSDDGTYEYNGVGLKKPEGGVFIRGRITDPWGRGSPVRYGIEAFFAPEDKARAIEDKLRENAVAVVMVTRGGRAALKAVEARQASGVKSTED